MTTADTLYAAAQKTAAIAGLPWSAVNPTYRALQNSGGKLNTSWLPKSVGRAVWTAHPNFISRLLIGLAAGPSSGGAHEAIEWVIDTTPGGRARFLTEEPAANVIPPVELELFKYLTDSAKAADLVSIEFRKDKGQVIFHTKSQGDVIFARPAGSGEGRTDQAKAFQGIYSHGVIDGLVFAYLSKAIVWRTDQSPVDFKAEQEPAE